MYTSVIKCCPALEQRGIIVTTATKNTPVHAHKYALIFQSMASFMAIYIHVAMGPLCTEENFAFLL
jgi:hypothetical protein